MASLFEDICDAVKEVLRDISAKQHLSILNEASQSLPRAQIYDFAAAMIDHHPRTVVAGKFTAG